MQAMAKELGELERTKDSQISAAKREVIVQSRYYWGFCAPASVMRYAMCMYSMTTQESTNKCRTHN